MLLLGKQLKTESDDEFKSITGKLERSMGLDEFVAASVAIGETIILLHPPLPSVGVSIWMERERQQTDSLADG